MNGGDLYILETTADYAYKTTLFMSDDPDPVTEPVVIKSIGELGQMSGPKGIAARSTGEIYALDTVGQKVLKFDSNGEYVKDITLGEEMGEWHQPISAIIGNDGKLMILDKGRGIIAKYDENDNYESSVISGLADISVNDFAQDSDGNYYITSEANYGILVYDTAGEYLNIIGGRGQVAVALPFHGVLQSIKRMKKFTLQIKHFIELSDLTLKVTTTAASEV